MRGKSNGVPALTPAQEERRIEGLRMLARIIARHCLEHPERYGKAADADGQCALVNGRNGAGEQAPGKEGTP